MSIEPEKKGRTRALVREIAERILKGGQNPTQMMIRKMVLEEAGITPSPNLVSDELNRFWVEIGKTLSNRQNRPAVPDQIAVMIEKIWDTALAEAGNALASERAAASLEADNARSAAEEAAAIANRSQADLKRAAKEIDHLKGLLEEVRTKVASLTAENAYLAQEKQRLESWVGQQDVAHQAELARITAAHTAEIKRLADAHATEVTTLREEIGKQSEAWDGARKHLMLESDRVRESMRRDIERITRERDDSRQMESQIRIQRSAVQEQNATLTGRLEQAEKDLTRAQNVIIEQNRELAAIRAKQE
ncbi:DNA-binding protein [Burkholderia gladioli]|uniref:DNA-binding protein n=1 Tax=Burkholderia gladioli TaxID=28095 RepID=UPI00164199CB|nr:DNA-binding protein [Burkholderia gladioli]